MDDQGAPDAYAPENSVGGITDDSTGADRPAKKNPLDNLRPPWKAGQSGNLKGKAKRAPLSTAMSRMLDLRVPEEMLQKANLKGSKALPKKATFADVIVFAMVQQALKGNVGAFKEMLNRSEGRTPHQVNTGDTSKLDELMQALWAGGLPPVPDPEEADEPDLSPE